MNKTLKLLGDHSPKPKHPLPNIILGAETERVLGRSSIQLLGCKLIKREHQLYTVGFAVVRRVDSSISIPTLSVVRLQTYPTFVNPEEVPGVTVSAWAALDVQAAAEGRAVKPDETMISMETREMWAWHLEQGHATALARLAQTTQSEQLPPLSA